MPSGEIHPGELAATSQVKFELIRQHRCLENVDPFFQSKELTMRYSSAVPLVAASLIGSASLPESAKQSIRA